MSHGRFSRQTPCVEFSLD